MILDFPRMMFHRTKPPVVVNSLEEYEELGDEWSTTVFPLEPPEGPLEEPDEEPEPPLLKEPPKERVRRDDEPVHRYKRPAKRK